LLISFHGNQQYVTTLQYRSDHNKWKETTISVDAVPAEEGVPAFEEVPEQL
jgi:hypothetical protein